MSSSEKSATYAWNRGIFSGLRTLMHFIAAVQFIYAIHYDFSYVKIPVATHSMGNNFGGKFKYLTVINAIIQAIYFSISLLNDFIGTNEVDPPKTPLIRHIKDRLLATLAFPCSILVAVTFWALYGIDRELVFPKVLDAIFPTWLNHVMHTNIIIFMFLELCTSFRQYPSRRNGLRVLNTFAALYVVWVHIIKYKTDLWVYPVLDVLPLPYRMLFFAGLFIFATAIYIFGEFLNEKIWTKEIKLIKASQKKSK